MHSRGVTQESSGGYGDLDAAATVDSYKDAPGNQPIGALHVL
ncbi:hypothetical protein FOXG_21406 [Fusarium oxysporum f. sp. lycopersici 4287]|uniref:Uncharacterized protein n=1 Tax=Fusarium oxysporum f. sp. lycopersici (strain 4287 / CBS 123668 / FGSC 9935 / NRRL 34936) TaxID=426428 RepID=A0A0J9VXX6_FUSO4|nr:hypothetical protein FOXG_21406 [Fusarium oxysporum f. sp. lycopersici 4287]KNB15616.1 hypothetical protein FOXG_21406 [Fusarium oxysporum f. sp. lycopersici 4287]